MPKNQLLHTWYMQLNFIKKGAFLIIERIPEIAPLQRKAFVSAFSQKILELKN